MYTRHGFLGSNGGHHMGNWVTGPAGTSDLSVLYIWNKDPLLNTFNSSLSSDHFRPYQCTKPTNNSMTQSALTKTIKWCNKYAILLRTLHDSQTFRTSVDTCINYAHSHSHYTISFNNYLRNKNEKQCIIAE